MPAIRPLRLLLLLAAMTAVVAAAEDPAIRGEIPLEDVLEIVVLKNKLLSIDARGGGQREIDLELGESVLWTGTQGRVGVALTDRRVLAVATQSGFWQQTRYRLTESVPKEVLLGDRVALLTTEVRVIGYDGGSGNLIEHEIGPNESVRMYDVGKNVAVAVTTRRALGLSPFRGGFFEVSLRLGERLEGLSTRANLATLTTSQRLLTFRSPSGTWEERNLDLY